MGEAKLRRISQRALVANAKRCVYCQNTTDLTLEHMPPIGMFKKRDRPKGWEFACCSRCNQGTRGADAVAQFFAKMEPIQREDWKLPDLLSLKSTLELEAPGVIDEVFGARRKRILLNQRGILHNAEASRADGPLTKKYLDIFSAKIAMAAFCNFVQRPIEPNGVIFTEWYLNGGLSQNAYEEITKILPMFAQLEQGKKISGDQFYARYNTDSRRIVAALISFHSSLHINIVATDGEEFVGPLAERLDQAHEQRPTANLTTPGLPELETAETPIPSIAS
jgi:hypothetical protein